MTSSTAPAPPGDIDPRRVFLTAQEVVLRYGWGRAYAYRMLKSAGSPAGSATASGCRLIVWEQAVLAGELPRRPDDPESPGDTATTVTGPEPEPAPPAGSAAPIGDEVPVAAPTRRRTRGTRRAA
jgi:hypothetical protein